MSNGNIESPKLIDLWFIAGVSTSEIKRIQKLGYAAFNQAYDPEILMQYPKNASLLSKSHLPLVFHTFYSLSTKPIGPKFTSTTSTDIIGRRCFLYSLKIYEDIQDEKIFVPVVIGLWSTVENQDFFKRILIYFYEALKFNPSCLTLKNLFLADTIPESSSTKHISAINDIIHNFRIGEICNLLIYLTKIIKPPPFTELRLNLNLLTISLYVHSNFDLPNKDSSLQILLDCLELTIIIKLWTSLLSERNVILLGNRSILSSACSALLALLFPFSWLHTYIPTFPDHFELEILDAPTPYLIGLPNYRKDFKELNEMYPNHVICCLSTSRISKINYVELPEQEEAKLRTKVRYLRYPKLDKIDEVVEEPDIGVIKDIRLDSSFPQNIQRIFFRIFKDNLKNFERYLDKHGKFNQMMFLDNLDNSDDKQFWEEIINSQAFENFLLGFNSYDCQTTNIFKNILRMSEDDLIKFNKMNSFTMTFNIPIDLSYIFQYVKEESLNDENGPTLGNQELENFETIEKDHRIIISKIFYAVGESTEEQGNEKFNEEPNNPYQITTSKEKISVIENSKDGSIHAYFHNNQGRQYTKVCELPNSVIVDHILKRAEDLGEADLNSMAQLNETKIYGNRGLLEVFGKLFKVNIDNIDLLDVIKPDLSKYLNENQLSNSFRFRTSDRFLQDYQQSYSTAIDKDNLIELSNKKSAQYFLSLAFLFQEYAFESSKEFIFNCYLIACFKDITNFSNCMFISFLQRLSLDELNQILTTVPMNHIVDITKLLIKQKKKELRKSMKVKRSRSSQAKSSSQNVVNKSKNSTQKSGSVFKSDVQVHIDTNSNPILKSPHCQIRKNARRQIIEMMDSSEKRKYLDDELEKGNVKQPKNQREVNELTSTINIFRQNIEEGTNINLMSSHKAQNNLQLINSTNRDPYSVSVELAEKTIEIINFFNLAVFKSKINKSTIKGLTTQHEKTQEFYKLANEIGKVNLEKLKSEDEKLCFFINTFNSLVIFNLLNNSRELPNSIFNWQKFIKSNYNQVGLNVISLLDLLCIVIQSADACEGQSQFFMNNTSNLWKVRKNMLSNFCLTIPTELTPTLRVFTVTNIDKQISEHSLSYFNRVAKFDKGGKGLLKVPQSFRLVFEVDTLNADVINTISKLLKQNIMAIQTSSKGSWNINFHNFT